MVVAAAGKSVLVLKFANLARDVATFSVLTF